MASPAGRNRSLTLSHPRLRIESLEDRLAPIVGAFAEAPLADTAGTFGGVVEVLTDDGLGSGTLIYTGRHVLTAAHVVDENGDRVADSAVTVRFHLPTRTVDLPVAVDQVLIWPGWRGGSDALQGETGKDDLALLFLPALAPAEAGRFDLNRTTDELGESFLMLGYGRSGTGTSGGIPGTAGDLRFGFNRFDTTGRTAPDDYLVPPGYGLVADFDDGTPEHDALGRSLGIAGLGFGADEASIGFGDSGGPAFLYDGTNYLLAGVAVSLVSGGPSDVDIEFDTIAESNSSFGDLMGYTRVSAYADGIDALARDAYHLVVDLNYQPAGNDGSSDTVQVAQSGGTVGVYINGQLVHSDARGRLLSVTAIASADGGAFGVLAAVAGDLYVQAAGFAASADDRPVVTAEPVPGVRPVAPLEPAEPERLVAVGADFGFEPRVRVYDPTGAVRFDFLAMPPELTGGVRVALGDVNGDGFPDVIAGAGPGGPPLVRVFDGRTGGALASFLAFEESFRGGVYVGSGDFTTDGLDDLVVTPDEGGGPRVRVLTGIGQAVIADFFGIEDPNFRGGARAAVGDLNGDGFDDLLIGAGFGGGPRVAGFDGRALPAAVPTKLFADFFVFEPTLRNGVYLAAGDLNLDQFGDVIVGGGPGGGPRVLVLSGRDLLADNRLVPLANFFAGDTADRGGVRVTAKDLDADGFADIVAGSGEGAGSRVIAYVGGQTPAEGSPPASLIFDAFSAFGGGVFVG